MKTLLRIFFLPLVAGLLFGCKSLPPSVQTTIPNTKYIEGGVGAVGRREKAVDDNHLLW